MNIVSLRRSPAPAADTDSGQGPSADAASPATPAPGAAGAGIALGVLLGEVDGRYRVRLGAGEQIATADASVDPALLREAIASGARAVLDTSAPDAPLVVGLLATARAVTIDRDGAIEAKVRRISLTASEEALLAGPGAFVRLKLQDAEIYGRQVVSRAREVCRVLGRMVKIN